jgi:signal transduction histidine kinase
VGKPLRVLIIEDVEADAALLVRELQRGGFELTFERVDCAEGMVAALTRGKWDLIVSDYSLPRFSAPAALAIVKEQKLDVPFIIVSGTVGEATAVGAIRSGAHDFMTKGQFARLVPAVERELREAAIRAEGARMHEQLLISDRMASVGTLAAGVAHEINNPLAALIANLTLLSEELEQLGTELLAKGSAGGPCEELSAWAQHRLERLGSPLRDASEASERVRLIVRDLKVFSRADEERRGPVDVHRVLDSSLRMAKNEIRHRARLVQEYGAVPFVHGNEARLGQVFLNLVINAAQAIPEGQAQTNEIRVGTREDGGFVTVEVADTGVGMDEAVLARVFDPFFTTKPIGIGTGLGLAICYRIVDGLGGRIEVESTLGKGSVFKVLLPATFEQLQMPSQPAAAMPSKRRGRVLVVDDEPMIGGAVRRMLVGEHDVEVVSSAREALRLVGNGERFDAILCDLMMPELTGMDFHERLCVAAPEQVSGVIFMTGGAFTARAREFLDSCQSPHLEKPFKAATLRTLVRERVV